MNTKCSNEPGLPNGLLVPPPAFGTADEFYAAISDDPATEVQSGFTVSIAGANGEAVLTLIEAAQLYGFRIKVDRA